MNTAIKGKNIFALIIWISISELAGVIGSLFTAPAIGSWYATLQRPALSPPNWVFGPVWTTLYLLMGIAAYLVWRRQGNRKALAIFVLQLILNALWSIIFFGLQNPGLALIELVLLWGAIVWTMVEFRKHSKIATLLLIPYIFWVTFAAYLNYSIQMIN